MLRRNKVSKPFLRNVFHLDGTFKKSLPRRVSVAEASVMHFYTTLQSQYLAITYYEAEIGAGSSI